MTARKTKPKLDHPDQAMDTPLPDEKEVNKDHWKALVDNYEGDPDEVDGHTDDVKEKDNG